MKVIVATGREGGALGISAYKPGSTYIRLALFAGCGARGGCARTCVSRSKPTQRARLFRSALPFLRSIFPAALAATAIACGVATDAIYTVARRAIVICVACIATQAPRHNRSKARAKGAHARTRIQANVCEASGCSRPRTRFGERFVFPGFDGPSRFRHRSRCCARN